MEVSRRALGLMASLGKPHRFAWPSDIANALGHRAAPFVSFVLVFFLGGRLGSDKGIRGAFLGGIVFASYFGGAVCSLFGGTAHKGT